MMSNLWGALASRIAHAGWPRWHFAAFLLVAFQPGYATSSSSPTVRGYTLVSVTKVGTRQFNLAYRAQVQNPAATPLYGLVMQLTVSPKSTVVVVKGTLSFGNVGAHQTVQSLDTFVLQFPTKEPSDNTEELPKILTWSVVSGPAQVAVPNVNGLTQAAAASALTSAGLILGTVTQASSATVPAGSVISETPAAGTLVAPRSAVNVVVSTGAAQVAVPNVSGLTPAAAASALTSAGLILGTVTQASSATVLAGSVISETPAAATLVAPGSAVNLVISTGAAQVAVPTVTGLTQAAASAAITGAGLTVGTITTASSTTVVVGNIISESPAAATLVTVGSAVNLVVSSGPARVAVPAVTGLTQGAATTALTNASLTLGTVSQAASTSVATGNIISESPAAATAVTVGSAVNLVVSTGTPPIAQGTLAAGVVPLTAAQVAQIASESQTSVIFNGAISLPPGTVFLTATNAFYALQSTVTATQTTVAVQPAALQQIFSALQVAGTYEITPTTATAAAAPAAVAKRKPLATAAALGTAVTFTVTGSAGPISATGTINAQLTADVSLDYSLLGGASGYISLASAGTGMVDFAVQTTGAYSYTDTLSNFIIPIPVTTVDALLRSVGIYTLSVQVPVTATIGGTSQYNSTLSASMNFAGTIGASYVNGALSPANSFGGAVTVSAVPTVSLISTGQVEGYAYVDVSPQLVFLNNVEIAGVDFKFGPHAVATVTLNSTTTPQYCAQFTSDVYSGVTGFFSLLKIFSAKTPLLAYDALTAAGSSGACTPPPTATSSLQLTLDPSDANPVPFWTPFTVDAKVTGTVTGTTTPPAPSGVVIVNFGASNCQLTLNATGSGTCQLQALTVGADQTISATYTNGDSTYPNALARMPVSVALAGSGIQLTASPTSVAAGGLVAVSATVVASAPVTSALPEPVPGGMVTVLDSSSNFLCKATLTNGKGTCSVMAPATGTQFIVTGDYSGDVNFNSVTSSPLTIPITTSAATQVTVSIIGVVGPLATDYSGVFLNASTLPVPPYGDLTGLPFTLVYSIDTTKGLETTIANGSGGLSFDSLQYSASTGAPVSATLTINGRSITYVYAVPPNIGLPATSEAQISYFPTSGELISYDVEADTSGIGSNGVTFTSTTAGGIAPPITIVNIRTPLAYTFQLTDNAIANFVVNPLDATVPGGSASGALVPSAISILVH